MLTSYTIQLYKIQLWAAAVADYGILGAEMGGNYQLATELLVIHLMQEGG